MTSGKTPEEKRGRARRFTILFLGLDILAIAGMFWLINMGQQSPDNVRPEYFERVGSVFGAVIGVLTVFTVVAAFRWLFAKR